jgi:hypothetical protein
LKPDPPPEKAFSEAGRWFLRISAVAVVLVMGASTIEIERVESSEELPVVQAEVVRNLLERFWFGAAEPGPHYTLAYFGDSFVQPTDGMDAERATPFQLGSELRATMQNGIGKPPDIRVVPITYTGLSQWSLYYMAERLISLRPDYLVIEFNLYNFSDLWHRSDRRILSSMLELERFPEALRLPLGNTGLTIDELLFAHTVVALRADEWWASIQREQAKLMQSYRALGDAAQQLVGASSLRFRDQLNLASLKDNRENGRHRSTSRLARRMLGRSLEGVDKDEAALKMLDASLKQFANAGIVTLVYVPPYNVDHLRELGLLDGSHLGETIARVREVAERNGARFHDAHQLLPDAYFHDETDHLLDSGDSNGHRAVALDLARVMRTDWERILAHPPLRASKK